MAQQTDENGKPLTYWGGVDFTNKNANNIKSDSTQLSGTILASESLGVDNLVNKQQTICLHCGEKENFHFNYDYTQKHMPVINVLCNECGGFFNINKEEQKQLLIEIMEADANDGLYKKQTAVEWLLENVHIIPKFELSVQDILEQAKQMEKEQIAEAYETGWANGDLKKAPRFGSDYYEQTFNK